MCCSSFYFSVIKSCVAQRDDGHKEYGDEVSGFWCVQFFFPPPPPSPWESQHNSSQEFARAKKHRERVSRRFWYAVYHHHHVARTEFHASMSQNNFTIFFLALLPLKKKSKRSETNGLSFLSFFLSDAFI